MVIHKSVSVKSIHFIRERDPNSLEQTNKIISLIDREKHSKNSKKKSEIGVFTVTEKILFARENG